MRKNYHTTPFPARSRSMAQNIGWMGSIYRNSTQCLQDQQPAPSATGMPKRPAAHRRRTPVQTRTPQHTTASSDVAPSVVDASIDDARNHDDRAEEQEDEAGGQQEDGSSPVVQGTPPEPEQAATPEEMVTTPANDNLPPPRNSPPPAPNRPLNRALRAPRPIQNLCSGRRPVRPACGFVPYEKC